MKLMDYMRGRAQADNAAAEATKERAQMAEALETLGVETEEKTDAK